MSPRLEAPGRRRRCLAGLSLLGSLGAATGCAGQATGAPITAGDPLPHYAAVTLAGDSVALRAFRGEVVLLNVWASWCPACEREMPSLQRLHEETGHRGLRVVGVSVDPPGSGERVREFLERFGISYPILLDPQDRISGLFGIIGIPTSYLVDRRGMVRDVWIGERNFGASPVRAALDSALVDARGADNGDARND